jgi:RimJ/RimL family protein N-acetyltransferase
MLLRTDDQRFVETVRLHLAALEAAPVRNGLIIALLTNQIKSTDAMLRFWAFATPGSCALLGGRSNIVLGDLAADDAPLLAALIRDVSHDGILGPGETVGYVADAGVTLGLSFQPSEQLGIHELTTSPRYPESLGQARVVDERDVETFTQFTEAFYRETVPQPKATPEQYLAIAKSGRYSFWLIDGQPVAMAGKVRETSSVGSIGGVYTLPDRRGRGYAGSITASVAARFFAEGKNAVSLYTDLRNPISNRCYAKIGFVQVATASKYLRKT